MSDQVTLEQVAAAREAARLRVEAAVSRIGELEPDWKAAGVEHRAALDELARIDLALSTAQRAQLITSALEATGEEYEGAPVAVVGQAHRLPLVFELVAVRDGVGLYLHRPEKSHRYQGKTYALREQDVPQEALEAIDARMDSLTRLRAVLGEQGKGVDHGLFGRVHPKETSGMVEWQARGKGDFGYNGTLKPLAPPSGARGWRWLKVADRQSTLASGN